MRTKQQIQRDLNRVQSEVDYWEMQKRKTEKKLKQVTQHLRYSKEDLERIGDELKKAEKEE